jgi:hypothetical protein
MNARTLSFVLGLLSLAAAAGAQVKSILVPVSGVL